MLLKIILASIGAILIGISVSSFIPEKTVVQPAGILCPDVPVQKNIAKPKPFLKGDYMITPLAEFSVKGRVLSRDSYSWDRGSDLSPVDFAMGWKEMSDQTIVDMLDITQRGRWYFWKSKDALPIPAREIEQCSSNMHMIPADEVVEDELDDVCRGNIIEFKGYLVKITGKGGFRWISSLTRDDTGNGACEVVYVEEISIIS